MEACLFGAFDSHLWLIHGFFLGAFGSPLHELSTHDDSFFNAFDPPFQELSTHDDWFHPDTWQNKGNQWSYPV